MRPSCSHTTTINPSTVVETSCRLSSLSIVIDDFDVSKSSNTGKENKEKQDKILDELTSSSSSSNSTSSSSPTSSNNDNNSSKLLTSSQQKVYTRQTSDASIKKILEEAELRKHEFRKLIDEHSAVIENLKRIEQMEHNSSSNSVCKVPPTSSPIAI